MLPPRQRFAVLRRLLHHSSFRAGFVLLLLIVLLAAFASSFTDASPTAMRIRFKFRPPSGSYPFGTDQFGRDVFSRTLFGARTSLFIGLAVTALSGMIGAVVGMVSGYFRAIDGILMRVMDALMAFPAILLAIGISAALGPQVGSVIAALTIAYVPRTARIMRASTLVIREMEYVAAARLAGVRAAAVILRHVLPNCLGPLAVQLSFVFAYAILAEAGLSFLGVGPPPPAPTWGNIIADGRDYAVEAWWIMLFPGIAVSLAALGMNLLGDGLRDVLDPHLKVET